MNYRELRQLAKGWRNFISDLIIIWRLRFVSSMNRKRNCWDNAPMESFWGKLKQEWLNGQHFLTREEARSAVFEYIWIFYNRKRLHEANGYLTPEAYVRIHQTDLKAA